MRSIGATRKSLDVPSHVNRQRVEGSPDLCPRLSPPAANGDNLVGRRNSSSPLRHGARVKSPGDTAVGPVIPAVRYAFYGRSQPVVESVCRTVGLREGAPRRDIGRHEFTDIHAFRHFAALLP